MSCWTSTDRLTRSHLAHRLILETRRKFKATKLITMAYYPDGAQVYMSSASATHLVGPSATFHAPLPIPFWATHSILGVSFLILWAQPRRILPEHRRHRAIVV